MTIEEILAGLQAIIDGAKGADGVERALTDEEVQRYEALEVTLNTARKSAEIVKRNQAYHTPVRTDLHVHAGGVEVIERTEQEKAFGHYLRTGQANGDLIFRAQSEGIGSAGGYLVPDATATRIIERLKGFGGLAAEVETITTATGNPLPWVTNDDTANQGEIVPEGVPAVGGADLVFGPGVLGAYKYEATGPAGTALKVSWELAQDSAFPLEAFIERKLAQRIHRKMARDWAIGTGIGQPQGALTGGTTGLTIASNAVGLTFANITAAHHLPDPAYRSGAGQGEEDGAAGEAIWVMNDASMALIEGLVDLNGRPLLGLSTNGISGKPETTLRGYRVVIDNAFPAFTAGGAKSAIFGNVRQGYVRRLVKDITLVVLKEKYAEEGNIGYLSWARADGMVQDPNAYTVVAAAA